MWKLNQFLSGDDGEREESFLEEESDGFCSLSPTQVCFSNSTSNLVRWSDNFRFGLVFIKKKK